MLRLKVKLRCPMVIDLQSVESVAIRIRGTTFQRLNSHQQAFLNHLKQDNIYQHVSAKAPNLIYERRSG